MGLLTMDNKFVEIMAKRSDAELIQIITISREDYLPEALLAAEREFKKRKLTVNQIESAMQELTNQQQPIEENANAPIGNGLRLLFDILGEFLAP